MSVVKSRDMHWGLLAQKDHKDINLASIRMLLVADGANPCEWSASIPYYVLRLVVPNEAKQELPIVVLGIMSGHSVAKEVPAVVSFFPKHFLEGGGISS